MLIGLLLFAPLFALGTPITVQAAGYAVTVTTTADVNDACATTGTAPCSLRDAIRFADAKTSADTTTITLPAGAYNLSQIGPCEDAALTGDLDISKNLVLNGADPATTIIDGVGSDRVFNILTSTITVSIANVTVRNGYEGTACGSQAGGIGMVGSVTLTNVVVTNNAARSVGGINSVGNLTLINSTVSNNHACGPGGIRESNGTLTLINSTVSGNTASPTPGSGVDCPGGVTGYAGGMDVSSVIHITNSTISGNSNAWSTAFNTDDAGGIRNSGTMTIAYSTIANNSVTGGASRAGGVVNRASYTTTMQGALFAGNAGGNCTNAGTLTSQGDNLADDGTCNLTQPTDHPNTNPNLGPLANNGGSTQTHALLPGSPAIDKAPATGAGCPATDQRGIGRPYGSGCDIGAFEFMVNALPAPKPPGPSAPSGPPRPLPAPPQPSSSPAPAPGGPPAPLPQRRA